MRKIPFLLVFLLAVASVNTVVAQRFSAYAIGFYNVENLFDTCHDAGKNDYEYLPDGRNQWNTEKYTHKLRNLSRVLSEMGTDVMADSVGCAVIGVAEVENERVLQDLVSQPSLKARNMRYCHIEGPDMRGIDCALLYNPAYFSVRDIKLVPYVQELEKDSLFFTRGFLTVSGTLADEHVTVVVNHLPSRFSESFYRQSGARQVRALKDSLLRDDPNVKVLVMGDMNDDPMDSSMVVSLRGKREIVEVTDSDMYNPWWNELANGPGTLLYRGNWNLFDQILLSPSLLDRSQREGYRTLKYFRHQVFRRDYLFQQEEPYKGAPLRTQAGGRWLDGYSDHLPTIVYLLKEDSE